ncbi:type IV secretion system protein VirB10 [Aureimonas altamirensis]|uniref:type IV secretion system protein VirB10 n=1 Tax=Aureimonas altamirensis TaxID=370622 RepID=UPI0025532D0E|nr:type IV secretion system protein VirB10 [Aureimonas altamirensis]
MSNTDRNADGTQNSASTEDGVEGERGAGITSVADERSASNNVGRAAVVVLIALAGLGFLWFTWDRGDGPVEEEVTTRTRIGPAVPFTPTTTPPPRQEEQEPVVVQPVLEVPEPIEPPVNEMLEASMRAPVIAFSSNTSAQQQGGGQGQGQPVPGGPDFSADIPPGLQGLLGAQGQQQDLNRLRDRLDTTPLEGVRASVIPDLHMVVPQGTTIPCVLQTALSSDQPGMVSCTIQRDVLSASGQVVLMEKGTVVVGEYESNLRRGQNRIFVLWNRARTPTGVIVNMASPATDGLGRSGFDGRIDNHFWERFGGAILMSIVGDASSYAFGELTDRSDVQTSESERATRDAASIALENSINIPPTLYKNQGEQVAIFVARDLDFGDVYQLRATETRNQIYDRTISGDMYRRTMVTK